MNEWRTKKKSNYDCVLLSGKSANIWHNLLFIDECRIILIVYERLSLETLSLYITNVRRSLYNETDNRSRKCCQEVRNQCVNKLSFPFDNIFVLFC